MSKRFIAFLMGFLAITPLASCTTAGQKGIHNYQMQGTVSLEGHLWPAQFAWQAGQDDFSLTLEEGSLLIGSCAGLGQMGSSLPTSASYSCQAVDLSSLAKVNLEGNWAQTFQGNLSLNHPSLGNISGSFNFQP
ncbi:MAG: hypothetical protein R2880_16560 [Deinococcales bacterium]